MKTVKDLIEELSKYPPNAPVVVPRVKQYDNDTLDEDGNDSIAMESPVLCRETVGFMCNNGNRRPRRAVLISYAADPADNA